MRYIIYSFCYETPHFETELEIAQNLLDEGHDVYFLICREELKTCFINPEHEKPICNVCKSKISNGLKLLNLPKSKVLYFLDNLDYSIPPAVEISSFESLKSYKYKGSDIGIGVISSLVSYTRDHNFDVAKYRDEVEKGLKTAIVVHENFEIYLESLKPDGVILFNGRFLESKPVIYLCEKLGINYYTHERGGQIDRYMFRENSTPHSLSFAKEEIEELWDNGPQDKIEIAKSFYEDRRNKVIQNWHVFSENQVQGKLPDNFNRGKRNIAIFNSSMDEYVTIPDFNSKIYLDDNEGIKRICESFIEDPSFHFYLRMHPNLKDLRTSQTQEINEINDKYENLTLINPEDEIDSYSLMESVESVMSFGSTVGIEAIYWGVPSILLGRAYFESMEGVIVPNSHDEICEMIRKKDKLVHTNIGAYKYGYWCLTYGQKYNFFEAQGLFYGKFLGKRITANLFPRIVRKVETILKSI